MGVPHFSSVFFACLYQKYLSEKIEQLLEVFFGIDEQLSKNKKKDKGIYLIASKMNFSIN